MSKQHTTYQRRGYVSRNQRCRLEDTLAQCAVLYNAALLERRDAWRMKGKSISFIDQCKSLVPVRADLPEREALDSNIGRGVLRRVHRAFPGSSPVAVTPALSWPKPATEWGSNLPAGSLPTFASRVCP